MEWNRTSFSIRFALNLCESESVYLLLLCRFWGHAENRRKKYVQYSFHYPHRAFNAIRGTHTHTHTLCSPYAEWFIVSWLENHTHSFLVSFSLPLFFCRSYIYHSIFIQIRCLGGSFQSSEFGIKTIAIFGNHSNNPHDEKESELNPSWNAIHYSFADKIVFMNFKRRIWTFSFFCCCSLDTIVSLAQIEMKEISLVFTCITI